MAHIVVVQRRAEHDILRASQYLEAQSSFSTAFRWFTNIQRSIDTLAHSPARCPLADEADELGLDLRMLLHGRKSQMFRILFVIDTSYVHVLRVRHAAQDRISFDDLN